MTAVRGLLIAAALVPVLVGAAGCGGDSTGGEGKSEAPGRALTAGELKRALVGTADLRGPLYEGLDEALPAGAGVSGPDNAACTPLVEQLGTFPRRVPVRAQAVQIIDDIRDKDAMHTSSEFLAGYAPGGARQTMAALRTALKSCKTFTVKDGHGGRVSMTTTSAAAVKAGDDAVAYLVHNGGSSSPTALLTVVRTGEQTATYQSFATFHKPPLLPKDVAVAQDKKLRAVAV
ncbi:hypothetical protein [Streptomyces sp. CA-111067]|uniref:hypothetical protein n=1 Tax=Streptomyces sp. CA-111067 TaxID=3240046 RepID=UPI003D96D7BB